MLLFLAFKFLGGHKSLRERQFILMMFVGVPLCIIVGLICGTDPTANTCTDSLCIMRRALCNPRLIQTGLPSRSHEWFAWRVGQSLISGKLVGEWLAAKFGQEEVENGVWPLQPPLAPPEKGGTRAHTRAVRGSIAT